MQPHSVGVQFCDQPGDAFDFRYVGGGRYLLAETLDPFVYFHARLAHGVFYVRAETFVGAAAPMAWSVDRLGRSLQDLVGFLSEIHAAGVDLFLYQQGIDTTTPGGKAMFQMLGVFAEFERSIIQERVRAGLRRAMAEGKQLGRPRIAPELEARILAALKAPGRTEVVRKIAKRCSVDPGTVQRISRPFGEASVAA
jgi:hypothetical protein